MNWKKNRIVAGTIALAALLLITLWAVRTRNIETHTTTEVSAPEVDKDELTTLEITRPGQDTVTLTKRDEDWWVTTPVEAEADENTVNTALNRISELKASGIVATRPENHARLEVDDAQAIHVVAKSSDATAVDMLIGKYAGGNTMVRFDAADDVYGINGSIKYVFDRELKAWRNRKVNDYKPARVRAISFQSTGGKFSFEKEGDDWKQVAPKKKIKKFDPKKVKGLVSSAARLTATDFAAPGIDAAAAGLTKPSGTITMVVDPDEKKEGEAEAKAEAEADLGTEAETEAEAEAETEAEAEPETVVLLIGDAGEKDTEFYLQREGNDTIYLVSKYLANRLRPDKEAFQASEKKSSDAPPPPPTGMPQMPPGMPGQHPQLPPEVMKQLQEQMRRQQQQQGQ